MRVTTVEAKEAVKNHILVGTNNIQSEGRFCLFSTGHLVKMVKVKGKKEKEFLFVDRPGEIKITRPASAFSFAN
jgi:hypothetical protein